MRLFFLLVEYQFFVTTQRCFDLALWQYRSDIIDYKYDHLDSDLPLDRTLLNVYDWSEPFGRRFSRPSDQLVEVFLRFHDRRDLRDQRSPRHWHNHTPPHNRAPISPSLPRPKRLDWSTMKLPSEDVSTAAGNLEI